MLVDNKSVAEIDKRHLFSFGSSTRTVKAARVGGYSGEQSESAPQTVTGGGLRLVARVFQLGGRYLFDDDSTATPSRKKRIASIEDILG